MAREMDSADNGAAPASAFRGEAERLATLANRLGPALADTSVVVISEFGRTLRENGTTGTDHGHGNAIWLLGGPIEGGRVLGRWPGLEDAALHEGRDLAITTDFRTGLSTLILRQMALSPDQLARVFPGLPEPAMWVPGLSSG